MPVIYSLKMFFASFTGVLLVGKDLPASLVIVTAFLSGDICRSACIPLLDLILLSCPGREDIIPLPRPSLSCLNAASTPGTGDPLKGFLCGTALTGFTA